MPKKIINNNRVSLEEVASAAGVSKMTASRVLRNKGGYTEATRKKIMLEVERLQYVPNRLAKVFSGETTSTFIGVSIPDLGNEVFSQVLDGINGKLNAFGHQAVLGMHQHSQDEEETWIETILSWQPAGLILTGRSHSARTTSILRSVGIPIVEIWDLNSSPLDMCVGINHYDSGFDMGRFLIGKGYKRLGYVGTSHDTANAASTRLDGFAKAVDDGGGTLAKQLCLRDTPGFYTGFYGTEQLLASNSDVDVIFFQNDNMAVGGMQFCQSKGLEIPDDIGIAGWGDLPISSIFPKRLTSTHVSHLKLGQTAAEKLLARLSNEPTEDVTDIGFRLVPGATV